MIIVKSPLRISLFGGSTDYEDFYSKHGSFLIGAAINKHAYLSVRYRSKILSKESVITYSKTDTVTHWSQIQNPLIRKTLEFVNVKRAIDFNSFSDMPARTGLGGSSSFCVGLLKTLYILEGYDWDKRHIARNAIHIERFLLKEAGGIQDQLWATYGGLNSIEIDKIGNWHIKPLPVTEEFREKLEQSIFLIYTNDQRNQDTIAKSHENKDKKDILDIAKSAYQLFLDEDIENIGKLLYESWKVKMGISDIISTNKIDEIVVRVMELGAFGAKLLGAGGCGFVLVIADGKANGIHSSRSAKICFLGPGIGLGIILPKIVCL